MLRIARTSQKLLIKRYESPVLAPLLVSILLSRSVKHSSWPSENAIPASGLLQFCNLWLDMSYRLGQVSAFASTVVPAADHV